MTETKPPTPIQTDLFHFVTIRTPQLISPDRKRMGFINHPDPSSSFFLKDLPGTGLENDRQAVRDKASAFTGSITGEQIRTAAPGMATFAGWLSSNRNTLTAEDLKALKDRPSNLPRAFLLKIWDTLFYQLVRRGNAPLRQACIQVIIADHFLQVASDAAARTEAERFIQTPRLPDPPPPPERFNLFLRRLAKARLVIPPVFSVSRKTSEKKDSTKPDINLTPSLIDLKNQHIQAASDFQLDNYNKIKRELQVGIASLPGPERDLQALADADTATQAFLSPETRSFLAANPKKGVSLTAAQQLIDGKMRAELQRAARLTSTPSGLNLPKTGGKPDPYSFVVSVNQVEDDLEILMTLYTGYPGAFARSFEYEFSLDEGNPAKGRGAMRLETGKLHNLTLRLFPKQKIRVAAQTSYHLAGSLALNNGDVLSLNLEGALNAAATHGQAQLPQADPPPDNSAPEEGRFFGISRAGIGVLRKVGQEVCCYVPGEVSRIENIMAREYKERSTRSLVSSETTTEDTTSVQVEDQSDTVSTTRNDLATEVANQLDKESSIGAGASLGVETKLGPAKITAQGNFDISSSISSSESDSEAQTYSQELINSAMQKVTQNTTSKRTSRLLSEYEENNRHGYDNRKGDQHVTGVFRWIDIIFTNRVINYGKRLMYEFLVPEPARFFKLSLEEKAAAEADSAGSDTQDIQPKSLDDNGIHSPDDINEDNYQRFGRLYGVTLPDPVTLTETPITQSFLPKDDPNGDEDPNAKERNYQFDMDFLMSGLVNYAATHVVAKVNFTYHLTGLENKTYFILKVYNKSIRYDKDQPSDDPLKESEGASRAKSRTRPDKVEWDLGNVKDGLPLTVQIKNVYDFSVSLVVTMTLDEQVTIDWQNAVYDALAKAYDDQVKAYSDAQTQSEKKVQAQKEKPKGGSPPHNRTIEKRELQRVAIEMLTAPFGLTQGEDFYSNGKCKVPLVEQTRRWEVYSSHVKFFEQAFEWDLMAYLFYPYYWAGKCDWVDLLQESEASDPIFAAFLQSGMARAIIPVRRGFEEAVNYYLETGDIWNGGGLVLDSDDDLYLSIDEELQEVEGFVGQEWQTRVPTTLTIIQGNSVYLEDEGLPCCDRLVESAVDTRLRPSTALLGGTVQPTG